MATDLFRMQLLAASSKSQSRSGGSSFFRRIEPLLFSQQHHQDPIAVMSQIVSQFQQEIDRLSSKNNNSNSSALVDRFVEHFSAAAAMSCSVDDVSARDTTMVQQQQQQNPSLAALLMIRPALSADAAAAAADGVSDDRYRLIETHANLLMDALERPAPSMRGRAPSLAAEADENDDDNDDDSDGGGRGVTSGSSSRLHQRGSVLLSPSKAKKPPVQAAAAADGFTMPPPPMMPMSQQHSAAVQRVNPPVLIHFSEFLRQSRLAQDPAVRAIWAHVVKARILRRVEERCDPLEQTQQFAALVAWKRSVIEPFVKILVLCHQQQQHHDSSSSSSSSSQRSEVEQWMGHSADFLYRAIARRRLEAIFDDIVDFPESRPHLQDMADAVARQPSLLHEVSRVTKAAITQRLQHAGASTGNVLYLVSQTCRALCVIRPGKAAGEALLRQVCDTTIRHLRARTDAVAAVVAVITDTQNQDGNAWARRVGGGGNAGTGGGGGGPDAVFAAAEELLSDAAVPSSSGAGAGAAGDDGPDILRMLLSVLTVPVIVKEYCRTLSERLLRHRSSEVNFESEKEVLERLKILLGEDACANADVILKDFETSVRWCRASSDKLPPQTSTMVVSAACWPTPVSDGPVAKLKLHPKLAEVATQVADSFHAWKADRSLILLPHHGFIEISVSQRQSSDNNGLSDQEKKADENDDDDDDDDDDAAARTTAVTAESSKKGTASAMVRRKFRINLVAASVVFYLQEQQPRPLKDVADVLQITQAELAQCLQDYTPQLFVIRDSSIELQSTAVGEYAALDDAAGGGDGADMLRKQAGAAPALPAGLTQGAVDMMEQMFKTMISNLGPRSGAQMEQSMRMLGQWSGSANEFRDVMNFFVTKGVICSEGSGTYKLVA